MRGRDQDSPRGGRQTDHAARGPPDLVLHMPRKSAVLQLSGLQP